MKYILAIVGIMACLLTYLIGLLWPKPENPYPSEDDSSELSKRAIGAVIRGCYESHNTSDDS